MQFAQHCNLDGFLKHSFKVSRFFQDVRENHLCHCFFICYKIEYQGFSTVCTLTLQLHHANVAVFSSRLAISLQASLFQIVGYRNLVLEVEKLRREPYDCENPDHEEMLMKVLIHNTFRKKIITETANFCVKKC